MQSKYKLGSMMCSVVLLAACAGKSGMMLPEMQYRGGQTPSEVLGDVVMMDKDEMGAAKVAMKRSMNPKVKQYARFSYAQHDANLKEAMRLSHKMKAPPQNSPLLMDIARHGQQEVAHLTSVDATQFDKVYIDDVVRDHKAGLQLLDKDIKTATDPRLKKFLENTRKHVEMHLQKAMMIQNDMR